LIILPKEITLTILANKGPSVPEIIRLLDWQDHPDHFVMVLECPSLCENLVEFMRRHGGSLDEETVRQIMWQAAPAANMCCLRGVLHRDIKLENLLINRETSEVELIDFGCGDILRRSPYKSYNDMYDIIHFFQIDTEQSCCTSYKLLSPAGTEYHSRGKYYCRPATVWSLGVLMFTMLCGRFPSDYKLFLLHYKHWSEPGLSKECCHLLRALLKEKPSRDLVWGKSCPTTGLRSSHKTTSVGVLQGEQALCSVLHLA
ncbi:hypothetical protein cypCar_00018315, partial [Cyprinus carpio]